MSKLWLVLGILASGMIFSSCAHESTDSLEDLKTAVTRYNEAFRWKNYPLAAVYLPPDVRPAFVANYEEDDKALHVEGYQIIQVQMVSSKVAEVRVRYRFLQLPSVVLEKRTVTQHWAKVGGRWTLEHEDSSIRPIAEDAEKDNKELVEEVFGGERSG